MPQDRSKTEDGQDHNEKQCWHCQISNLIEQLFENDPAMQDEIQLINALAQCLAEVTLAAQHDPEHVLTIARLHMLKQCEKIWPQAFTLVDASRQQH